MKTFLSMSIVWVGLFFLQWAEPDGHADPWEDIVKQADKLIIKPETYTLVVKDKVTFKIFLQNNMDRGVADISLVSDSADFDFAVEPQKMSVLRGQRASFEVTMSPKPNAKPGSYPASFRLMGGGRELKSLELNLSNSGPSTTPKQPKPAATSPPSPATPPAPGTTAVLLPEKTASKPADGLQARRTAVAPNLDGKLDEKAWKTAAVLSGFSTGSAGKAVFDTSGLILWDAENLYIALFCRDEKPETVGKDDSLEIQLAKSATGRPCYSLKLSPSGPPVLRLMADDKNPSPWTASGVRYAPGTDTKAWILEVAIPFVSLNVLAPAPGDKWFLRVNRIKMSGHAEQTYWAADASGVNQEKGFGPVVLGTAP